MSQGAPPDTSCLPSSSVRPGKRARPNTQPRPVSPSTSIAIRHTWQEQSPAKRKDVPRGATFLKGPGCHEDTAVDIVSVQAWLAGRWRCARGRNNDEVDLVISVPFRLSARENLPRGFFESLPQDVDLGTSPRSRSDPAPKAHVQREAVRAARPSAPAAREARCSS